MFIIRFYSETLPPLNKEKSPPKKGSATEMQKCLKAETRKRCALAVGKRFSITFNARSGLHRLRALKGILCSLP